MAETLIEALDNAAKITDRGYTFLDGDLRPTEWSFEKLANEAKRRARKTAKAEDESEAGTENGPLFEDAEDLDVAESTDA